MAVEQGEGTATAARRTVAVPFASGEDRQAPLTWSQRYYLAEVDAARPYGRSLAIPRLYPLRPDLSEDAVTDAVRGLLERFESLRGRIVRAASPRQDVRGEGTVRITVHELSEADPDPSAAARRVLGELAARPFDVGDEWPVRVAVVGRGGRPLFLALAFSHVAVDAFALLPVSAYLVARCAAADPIARTAPPSGLPGRQPREQAEAEASPAGLRSAERALRHAEQVLRRLPAAPTTSGRTVAGERFRFLRHRSAALDLAVGAVAARTGQSPAAVLAAAMITVDAADAGADYGALQLIAANRPRPETVNAVLPYSQPVLCGVETAGSSFAETVRRTAAASFRAYRFGAYPPEALAELCATLAAERGVRRDDIPTLNHRVPTLNYRPRASALPERGTDRAELARAAGDAETAWVDSDLLWQAGHYVSADVDETGIRLLLQVDTAAHPPRWAERWLAGLEHLLCAEAPEEPGA
ncbi:condensation domain-containing protein [Streptomyces sp. DW26H14]|uniref:condensation domain-containing protein n=1 Tax=Streptomyces sp. DW26H14 TaxID=3435395 RepID=UPI00403DF500